MSIAETLVRQSVSLPPSVARRVRTLAKTNRTSTNRILIDLIESGSQGRAYYQTLYTRVLQKGMDAGAVTPSV